MVDTDFEPQHKNMGRHIVSGVINSGAVQIVRVSCQLASVIVLSRLLPPSDFGLIAMAGPVYGFVGLFQDLGLSQATIQKPNINHDEVNAFFWLNVAAGILLTLVVIAISPLVGWYYNEPRIVPLTAAMGGLILVSCFGNQVNAILTRRMKFGALSINGAAGAVAGLGVSIAAALILKNYWALYLGMAAATIVPVVGTWIAARWQPTWPRRVHGMGAMLKFGAGVTSANISNFFSRNMDNVLIGWKWGEQPLGLYDRAYKLLLFPIQRVVEPVMTTIVPVLSRVVDEPDRYRDILLRTLSQLTLVTWPGIVWAIMLSDGIVPALLGRQWADAAAIFTPLAIAGLLQTVNYSMGCLYISQGRTSEFARWSFIGAIIDVASFFAGLPFGAIGVAIAYTVSEYIRTPFFWRNVTRIGPIRGRDVLTAIFPQMLATAGSGAVLWIGRMFAPDLSIPYLAAGLVLSYATSVAVMALSAKGRETLRHTLDAAQRVLSHLRSDPT